MKVKEAFFIMPTGSGASCDTLQQILIEKNYYEVTVLCVDVDSNGATFQSLTQLLFDKDDVETVSSLLSTLECWGRKNFGFSFESFMDRFTFLIDYAPNVQRIVGALVLSGLG